MPPRDIGWGDCVAVSDKVFVTSSDFGEVLETQTMDMHHWQSFHFEDAILHNR